MKRLSREEIERYSRQIVLPEIGLEGQKRLKNASVLLVGVGGLGSSQALYLAAAGVGRIGLIDEDRVTLSDLQRQVIYDHDDIGRNKVSSAGKRLKKLNPTIEIVTYDTFLNSGNALELCARYDIVLDGSDNFATRYLINDVCVLQGKPNIYGSVYRFHGQLSVFGYDGGPCYRCLYPYPPVPGQIESCAVGGVFGVLPGLIGCLQAVEAIKLITGQNTALSGRLLLFDALDMEFEEVKIERDTNCPVCGENPVIRQPVDYEEFCGIIQDEQIIADAESYGISAESLQKKLGSEKKIKLIDIREPAETLICQIDGSINVPYSRIESLWSYIKPDDHVVLFCRAGIRSARALRILIDRGYERVNHLQGGILAWIDAIDPDQPKY